MVRGVMRSAVAAFLLVVVSVNCGGGGGGASTPSSPSASVDIPPIVSGFSGCASWDPTCREYAAQTPDQWFTQYVAPEVGPLVAAITIDLFRAASGIAASRDGLLGRFTAMLFPTVFAQSRQVTRLCPAGGNATMTIGTLSGRTVVTNVPIVYSSCRKNTTRGNTTIGGSGNIVASGTWSSTQPNDTRIDLTGSLNVECDRCPPFIGKSVQGQVDGNGGSAITVGGTPVNANPTPGPAPAPTPPTPTPTPTPAPTPTPTPTPAPTPAPTPTAGQFDGVYTGTQAGPGGFLLGNAPIVFTLRNGSVSGQQVAIGGSCSGANWTGGVDNNGIFQIRVTTVVGGATFSCSVNGTLRLSGNTVTGSGTFDGSRQGNGPVEPGGGGTWTATRTPQ